MTGLAKTLNLPADHYREESSKPAIILVALALLAVGLPLGMINKKIMENGTNQADVSRYTALAVQITGNLRIVQQVLQNGIVDSRDLASVQTPQVTLITPVIGPTNMQEAADQDPNKLKAKLSAIYYSAKDPIATIDGENYHVGDTVYGFKILEIRTTEVVFRSPLGEKVIKYFYDYLDESQR